VRKKVLAVLERSSSKALNKHVVLEQPQDGRRDFLAKLRGDHDEPLVIARIEHNLSEFLLTEKVANQRFCVLPNAIPVEIPLVDISNLRFR
jgi:hypothetical protein